jgi:hypothetical protein
MNSSEITLLCIAVAAITFGAGFYLGWNDGAGWVRAQLGKSDG